MSEKKAQCTKLANTTKTQMTTLPENWATISINKLKKTLEQIDFENIEFWDFINLLKEKHVKTNVVAANYIFHKLDNEKQDNFIKQYHELADKLFIKYKYSFVEMAKAKGIQSFTRDVNGNIKPWEKDEEWIKDEDLSKMVGYIVSLGEKKYSSILKNKIPFLDMACGGWDVKKINNQPPHLGKKDKNEFLEDFANVFKK